MNAIETLRNLIRDYLQPLNPVEHEDMFFVHSETSRLVVGVRILPPNAADDLGEDDRLDGRTATIYVASILLVGVPDSGEVAAYVAASPEFDFGSLRCTAGGDHTVSLVLERRIPGERLARAELLQIVSSMRAKADELVGPLQAQFGGNLLDPGGLVHSVAIAPPDQDGLTVSRAFLEPVRSGAPTVPRTDTVDRVLALVGARTPQAPLVVAEPGQGRTTLAQCIAARLLDPEYKGALSGWSVSRLIPESVRATRDESLLLHAAGKCRGSSLLFIDDVDVLCGLGFGNFSNSVSTVLRGLLRDPELRLVLTIPDDYVDRFAGHDLELFDELRRIDMTPMTEAEVMVVAQYESEKLAGFHQVRIPPDVVARSAEPRRDEDQTGHPALAVARLDRAATTAAMRDRVVQVADLGLDVGGEYIRFDGEEAAEALAQSVVGQDEAIRLVTQRIALTRSSLDVRPERPDGVFLFAGPTGTGKTELALALAKEAYGSKEALIRIDMSEFNDRWSLSKLIGSGPGYIGSDEPESWLTTRIMKMPRSVVLLDEIEKAHPNIWNAFLQVFDAGRMTDGMGRVADFREAIVIMTTNIGAERFADRNQTGFVDAGDTTASDEQGVRDELKEWMSPELLNRLDEVLVFRPLTQRTVRLIVEKQLAEVIIRLESRGWQVSWDEHVIDLLCELGYSKEYGARPLLRVLERSVLGPVGRLPVGHVRVSVANGEIVVASGS